MNNKIQHLRDHLFATLEALQDKADPMDTDRARAIAKVAEVVVESAKAENEFLEITQGTNGSGFIPRETEERPPIPPVGVGYKANH